jgi:hypothetical protein
MYHQEAGSLARMPFSEAMRRRTVLQTLAGGAITSVLMLAGCKSSTSPPTPIATSTPSPVASPTPASSGNAHGANTPTESALGATSAARGQVPPIQPAR